VSAPSSTRRTVGDPQIAVLLFVLCFGVYNANLRLIASGDSLPARFIPFAVWQQGTVYLEPVLEATVAGYTEPYWIHPTVNGRPASLYPVVTPVVVAPLYAPAVLYLHGIRWSLGSNLFRIARWRELGFNVLAIDYRGFGRSDGDLPSEVQIYADARAAWNELAKREPNPELRFIYGHSLGAAVALELAANVDNAAGVIAEAGFTSVADIIAESYAPLNLLVSQKFDALARAKLLKAPVLFMHGTADRYVPPAMSEKLFAAAPQPKKLHLIEGANHGNWNGAGLDDYKRVVLEFVRTARDYSAAKLRRSVTPKPALSS